MPVPFAQRVAAMARILKSSGVNGVVFNDVNACGDNVELLRSAVLRNVTRNLGPIFRKYALTPYFSACFDSPTILSNVTSDPLAAEAQAWWGAKADEVVSLMPGFGGWLVKADSEGNGGPIAYNRTEADGANLLARAIAPHGGIIMWRAFVYANGGAIGNDELVKQSFETFVPLDGEFDANVVLQVRGGGPTHTLTFTSR